MMMMMVITRDFVLEKRGQEREDRSQNEWEEKQRHNSLRTHERETRNK